MSSDADDRAHLINHLIAGGYCASAEEVVSASAPARLDVSGGLAAHSGGVVAQSTLGMRATAAVAPRGDGYLWIFIWPSGTARPAQIGLAISRLLDADWKEDFSSRPVEDANCFNLVLVVMRHVATRIHSSHPRNLHDGLSIGIDNAIRLRGSTAAANALAAALVQCLCEYYRIVVSPLDKSEMTAHSLAEIGISTAHTVDALTAFCAPTGGGAYLLRYRCQPHQLLGTIPIADHIKLLAIELDAKNADAPAIAQRVLVAGAMGMRIIETVYRDLGLEPNTGGYLGNISPGLYKRYFRALLARRMRGRDFTRTYGDLPGIVVDLDHFYHIRAAVDHLIGEGEYAENFLQTMEELAPNWNEPLAEPARILSAHRAGRLLLASQHSYRLRLGLSSPSADWVIARLTDAAPGCGAYGARVAEIGDGQLVVVLMSAAVKATDHLLGVVSEYGREFGFSPRVYRTGEPSSAGALLS